MVVAGADGVVQWGDALVIGLAGVLHLIDDPLHQVELPLQGRVQEQRQRVEADPQPTARALRAGLLQVGPLALPGGSGFNSG